MSPKFNLAFDKMMMNEGGFVLHSVPGDRGGLTFAGIARNHHYDWDGWKYIDKDDLDNPELKELVKEFYHETFWIKVKGDEIDNQRIAETIFDFAVNAGIHTASTLAQGIVGVKTDGVIGPITLSAINEINPELFIYKFAVLKISKYAAICNRDSVQKKFLLGWINRTISQVL